MPNATEHLNNYNTSQEPIVDPGYDSDSSSTSSGSSASTSSSNSDSTYSYTNSHTDTINDLNDELDRKESVIKQKDRKATRLISIIREKNQEIENLKKKVLDTQKSAWKCLADKNKEISTANYERDQAINLHNQDSALVQQAISNATYYQTLYYSTINNNSYYTNNIFDIPIDSNNYNNNIFDNIDSNV
tara:strand:+ start:205 stop:771 length:567 start_codon:yes stop_codon:yes gene_type:complete